MVDPTLLDGVIPDDIERLHRLRRVAHKASCEFGGHLITKNKVEGQMAIWTRKNGMAVKSYLAVKKPVRP